MRRFLLASALFTALVAHAQQTDAPRPLPQVEVKGASTDYDARRDDTAMKIVIGRQDLERPEGRRALALCSAVPKL